MFADYDRSLNIMSISDADVATDWRNGMLRSIAKLITTNGQATGIRAGVWGSVEGFVEGSLAEHFYKQTVFRPGEHALMLRGTGECKIVNVTNVSEDTVTEYDFNTFGSDRGHDKAVLTADVICEHGIAGQMSVTSSMGEMIYDIATS